MANTSSHVLLVEGEGDRGFFEQVCKLLILNPEIQVAIPKDCQGWRNAKPGIIERLPILLKDIEDGKLEHLAIVIDADFEQYNEGCQKTIKKISEIVETHGFALAKNQEKGLYFTHNDGFADIGLWIMPNNQDEGMLENFIKQCVKADEQSLFNHAMQTIQNLPVPKKFKPHHDTKAEIATWLAWQRKPGHGLYHVLCDDLLIDTNNALFQELEQWLKNIFPNSSN